MVDVQHSQGPKFAPEPSFSRENFLIQESSRNLNKVFSLPFESVDWKGLLSGKASAQDFVPERGMGDVG